MRPVSRRAFLSASGASLAGLVTARMSAAQQRRYRVLLNSNFSGPQAFFFVAQDRGYLKAAGLDVAYVEGDGAAAIVPRVARRASTSATATSTRSCRLWPEA